MGLTLTFVDAVLVFIAVVATLAAAYYSRKYYRLRKRQDRTAELEGELALEIHRNNVLADRAEVAEKKLAFDEKTIDSLLLVPQGRCHDGALRRPTVAVIRDGEGRS